MTRRKRRAACLGVEGLEERELLNGAETARFAARPVVAAWLEQRAARVEQLSRPRADNPTVPERVAAAEESKPKTLNRYRVTIYGLLVPAPLVSDGKQRGAALVSGGVVWFLDTTAVKGFDVYAQVLLGKALAVFGTAEIEQDAKGETKRKFKVGWMEPLKSTSDMPPAFPDLQPILHPGNRHHPAG